MLLSSVSSRAPRAGLRISGILSAAVVLCLAVPEQASANFQFKDCGSSALRWTNVSVVPDPITGSGAALPFRWEVTYNPLTSMILHSEFVIGAPSGFEFPNNPVPFLVRLPVAGNVIGSATYDGPGAGFLVPAGDYPLPAAGVTVDGVTVNWQATLLKNLDSTVLQSVTVTLEKNELGMIPGTSYQNINDLDWLTSGDYYIKVQGFNSNGGTSVCNELYFTNDQGGTAPIAFLVPPGSAQAAALVTASDHIGPGKALARKAAQIEAAVNAEDTATACAGISDYLALVNAQSGKKLTEDQADDLTDAANAIREQLDC
jgi:hypothetical protein